MKTSDVLYISPTKIEPLAQNPRKISKESFARLVESIEKNGFWAHRPLGCEWQDGELVTLAGNQRLKAARRLKLDTVPVIIYDNLTDEERAEIVLRDNVNNGEWDTTILDNDMFSSIEFEEIGIDIEDITPADIDEDEKPTKKKKKVEEVEEIEDEEEGLADDKLEFYNSMLGDFLYDSDNVYEIPTLLLDQQPVHIELPFTPWGANSRLRKDVNTYHFYVDDYRFEHLFKDPIKLLVSGCRQIVEPNCSIHDQTPIAHGLFQIYRKRYLARYFQECGVKVWVDLNVSHKFAEYNKLGVPKGYNAFFTRGMDGWMKSLEMELAIAQEISGLQKPNLCVYGGGQEIQDFCREHGLLYITDFINSK